MKKKMFAYVLTLLVMGCTVMSGCKRADEKAEAVSESTQSASTSEEAVLDTEQEAEAVEDVSADAIDETATEDNLATEDKQEETLSDESTDTEITNTVITINPQTSSNIRFEGMYNVYVEDAETGEIYHFDETTKVNEFVTCNSDDIDSMKWINRYLEHDAVLDESDPSDPYFCMGFAPGDIWEIEVDENNHILTLISITYWD